MMVGFSQTDITPPLGAEMPGGFAKRFSTGVHDPLHAKAAVFDDGSNVAAFVQVDCLSVKASIVRSAREKAHELCGIPSQNILIAATHTHWGGPVADALGSESDPNYCQFLAQQIGSAVAMAYNCRKEAKIACGIGHEETVAFNRRFWMKDGSQKTHPGRMNPDIVRVAGPIDPQVGVLAAQDLNGKFLGCLVNYTLHCTVIGGTEFSADYPFYLSETVRKVMGEEATVVFLNGACGDVTQVANLIAREHESGEKWAWRIGTILGGEVLKVVAALEFSDEAPVQVVYETIRIPTRKVPPDMLTEAKRLLATEGKWDTERWYARELVLLDEMNQVEPEVEAEVMAVRIGDSAFVAIAGEYFCQFGLDIKALSPFPKTFIVTHANGMVGYVPTEEAMRTGGYEPRLARSSKLVPEAGRMLQETALSLLHRLHPPKHQNTKTPKHQNTKTPYPGTPWDAGASPPRTSGLFS